jgi:hypothetical protein
MATTVAGIAEVQRLGGHTVSEGALDERARVVAVVAAGLGVGVLGGVPAHRGVEDLCGPAEVAAVEGLPGTAEQLTCLRLKAAW